MYIYYLLGKLIFEKVKSKRSMKKSNILYYILISVPYSILGYSTILFWKFVSCDLAGVSMTFLSVIKSELNQVKIITGSPCPYTIAF